jgi:hypothetical protein
MDGDQADLVVEPGLGFGAEQGRAAASQLFFLDPFSSRQGFPPARPASAAWTTARRCAAVALDAASSSARRAQGQKKQKGFFLFLREK